MSILYLSTPSLIPRAHPTVGNPPPSPPPPHTHTHTHTTNVHKRLPKIIYPWQSEWRYTMKHVITPMKLNLVNLITPQLQLFRSDVPMVYIQPSVQIQLGWIRGPFTRGLQIATAELVKGKHRRNHVLIKSTVYQINSHHKASINLVVLLVMSPHLLLCQP